MDCWLKSFKQELKINMKIIWFIFQKIVNLLNKEIQEHLKNQDLKIIVYLMLDLKLKEVDYAFYIYQYINIIIYIYINNK